MSLNRSHKFTKVPKDGKYKLKKKIEIKFDFPSIDLEPVKNVAKVAKIKTLVDLPTNLFTVSKSKESLPISNEIDDDVDELTISENPQTELPSRHYKCSGRVSSLSSSHRIDNIETPNHNSYLNLTCMRPPTEL